MQIIYDLFSLFALYVYFYIVTFYFVKLDNSASWCLHGIHKDEGFRWSSGSGYWSFIMKKKYQYNNDVCFRDRLIGRCDPYVGENLLRLMWFPQSLKPGRHDIQKTTCLKWPKGFSFLQKKKKKAIPSGSMIRPVQISCGYRMPLVEQELLTLQEYLASPPILSGVHAALCGILLFFSFSWPLYFLSFDLRLLVNLLVS